MKQQAFISAIAAFTAVVFPTSTAMAQAAPSVAVSGVIAQARSLLDRGEGAAARVTLDSLVEAQQPGSVDLAEALFWRATVALSVADAERDWKRLLVEAPLALRASDALIRLTELEMTRGKPASARQYAERLLLDHANSPNRSRAQFWLARSWFDENDAAKGCSVLSELRGQLPESATELRLQSDELLPRCALLKSAAPATKPAPSKTQGTAAPPVSQAPPKTDSASAPPVVAPGDAKFSVQLAAYNRLADAEALVKRLAARKIDARVDGTVAPFRVRHGYYSTKADAAAALNELTRRGLQGFVAELTK